MGAYKRDVPVGIKMGAYVSIFMDGCLAAYYPDFTVLAVCALFSVIPAPDKGS